jgi:flagellar motor switch protein FliG
MAQSTMRGPEKAVVFLLSLEESTATQLLSQLEESEIRKAREVLETLGNVAPEALKGVHDEFLTALERQSVVVRGGGDHFRRLTTRAFGPERAARLLQEPKADATHLLGRVDTTTLAGFLGEEHPQTVAAILAHLEPERAAEVLGKLDDATQCEVAVRMSALDSVPRPVLEEAERVLAAGLAPEHEVPVAAVDGVRRAAAILNRLSPDTSQALLARLSETNSERAMAIKRAMFTFEDIGQLDRRGMLALLKEVATQQLVLALKTASDELRDKILGAMSKRAAETLLDDVQTLGAVRLADVERAQQEIAEVALRMQSEGKLSIATAGGDQYV